MICVWCLTITLAWTDEPNELSFQQCPSISTRIFSPPYCECRHGPAYDEMTNTCPNPECPTASVGELAYPNCTCTEVNFSYSEYINECFRVCPQNSSGFWPNCICDDKSTGFDKSMLNIYSFLISSTI